MNSDTVHTAGEKIEMQHAITIILNLWMPGCGRSRNFSLAPKAYS